MRIKKKLAKKLVKCSKKKLNLIRAVLIFLVRLGFVFLGDYVEKEDNYIKNYSKYANIQIWYILKSIFYRTSISILINYYQIVKS